MSKASVSRREARDNDHRRRAAIRAARADYMLLARRGEPRIVRELVSGIILSRLEAQLDRLHAA